MLQDGHKLGVMILDRTFSTLADCFFSTRDPVSQQFTVSMLLYHVVALPALTRLAVVRAPACCCAGIDDRAQVMSYVSRPCLLLKGTSSKTMWILRISKVL